MPRFDDEQELLEKLRDDAGKMKLWTEYTPKGLENTRYEIINDMVILTLHYGRIISKITGNLIDLYRKSSDDHLFLQYFDVKIDDDNIYLPKAILEKRQTVNGDKPCSTEPIIIFEILTDKNKHLLNAKFEHYQRLESLQEYVLIDLNSPQIFVYRKANDWKAENFTIEQSFKLNSIDYTAKVADIYQDIEF
ncbi:MAG: Uma2 family endonuclease [Moraxella sp.]|uniref:Uma2 family endonuclease n=1 Tax=Moraxella sp. TaxID=479 RepID=UPI0026DD9D23|nr:Uma2 family endonuclease [Moraxella sp.]MDO4449498.1 Uma2 family endonuclease [Moraxella sp.]